MFNEHFLANPTSSFNQLHQIEKNTEVFFYQKEENCNILHQKVCIISVMYIKNLVTLGLHKNISQNEKKKRCNEKCNDEKVI